MFAAVSRSIAPIRAGTWWEYKTPVVLGVVYATALAGGVPFSRLWPAILASCAALVPLASYVCVINDITDERDDVRAGKCNRMAGKPAAFKFAWLLACLAGCCLAGVFCFRGQPVAAGLYAANWLAFTLYSVPPLRLKSRGLAGALADASGGTLLPALWSSLIADPTASPALLAAVAVWAGAFGLRGILYHQAGDLECDRDAGVGTLAVRFGPQRVASLVTLLLFPAELAALGTITWMARMRHAIPLLLVYSALQGAMWRFFRVHTVLVLPRERHRFAMLKYYQFWFPLAGLLQMAAADPRAYAVIAAHLALFPETWWRFPTHVADADILGRLERIRRRLRLGRSAHGESVPPAPSGPAAAATGVRDAPSCDLHWAGSLPDAHARYAEARQRGPVCFDARRTWWCVLGHDAAVECLSDPRRFRGDPFAEFDPLNLAGDMPKQAWFRRILQESLLEFDRANVVSLTSAWMDRFLARLAPDGVFDAVADLAVPLIDDLAGHMIGLRPDEVAMLASSRPANRTDIHGNDTEAWHFFATRLVDRSTAPRTGALRVIHEHVRPGGLSEQQAVGLARVLWIGATATTNLLVASAMMRLVRHPEMQEVLRGNPALTARFVGEVLRIDSPVAVITRIATTDGNFFGQHLRADDVVKVCLLAANSDPAVFPNPDRVDLHRAPGRHIAFGFGPHICLGAAIARTLTETAVGEVVRGLPAMRPAEDLDALQYEIGDMRGLKRLRLRVS